MPCRFLSSATSDSTTDREIRVRNSDQQSSCELWDGRQLQSQINQPCAPPRLDHEREPVINNTKPSPSTETHADSIFAEQRPPCREPPAPESPKSAPLLLTRNAPSDGDAQDKQQRRASNGLHNPRRKSKTAADFFQPTPTEYLIDTLQNVSRDLDGARHRNWTFTARSPDDGLMAPLSRKQRMKFKIEHRVSLQEIVADYIYHVDRLLEEGGGKEHSQAALELDVALRKVFLNKEHRKYLRAREYSIKDVVKWSWVLKSSTPYKAILRILMLELQPDSRRGECPAPRAIPPFIPLLLLRQSLDTQTFRLILIYSLHLMSGQPHSALSSSMIATEDETTLPEIHLSEGAKPIIDPNTCATFVVRLLHHARQLWPQAQLPIVRTFAFYLTLLEPEGSGTMVSATPRNIQTLAGKCNTFLRLLSLPCKQSPFMSASIQQQAQFELLKAMAKNRPVLPVTRRGYRGIIAVQLAHKKTQAERQSAELKAPSWPPWKEEKSGIDSQRGIEGMKSRAMRVMSQMKEAGYSHTRWEEVSSILAGWDTDRSPTIQTRTLARQPWLLRGQSGDADHHTIWEARIRATRTVREAWACFLSYRDRGLPPRGSIYAAMAEKLIYRKHAIRTNFDQVSHAFPGDALETFAEPSSARDLIYVHTEPPTLNELINQMLSEGIRPQGRFLALLLHHAPTFRAGLEYLSRSNLSHEQTKALCTVWKHNCAYGERSSMALNALPDFLFSAFIYFLCRFSNNGHPISAFPIILGGTSTLKEDTSTLFSYHKHVEGDYRPPTTLAHAIELLKIRISTSPQAWVHLLSALNRDRITGRAHKMHWSTQRIIIWHEMLEIAGQMEKSDIQLGLQGFHVLCNGFSRAVNAGVHSPDAGEEALELIDDVVRHGKLTHTGPVCSCFGDMVNKGLETLKVQFDRLVLPDSKAMSLFGYAKLSHADGANAHVTLPPLLQIPSPAILHAFVRSLGLAEDYDGLLSLLRWMSRYATTLKEGSDELLNGDVMMRRTIVATRLFLEGHRGSQAWGSPRSTASAVHMREPNEIEHSSQACSDASELMSFSDPNLQEAYDIVTETHIWGLWPSDEEVEAYCNVHWENHEAQ
ncbi:hypothetical protein BDV25DRAFT_150577 [Aspergillus avenaceus]|uniref:Uncharacterized protein n=1 Tax=Aspergillus avenaceus TaxID=36643 RepID=A0A5N6U279_ASPAV|nr:hypothetical protein BDV25DRAFT_150577 [Aspergillus avenaceus]